MTAERRYKLGDVGQDGKRPVTDVVTGRIVGRVSCDLGPAILGLLTAQEVLEMAGPWDWDIFIVLGRTLTEL